MPKLKTHKSTAKRFKYSGAGKLLRTRGGGNRGGQSHLRRNRSKRAKRLYGEMAQVTTRGVIKRVKRQVPYLTN